MTIQQILLEFLKEKGYDGFYLVVSGHRYCQCDLKDFTGACLTPEIVCQAGYKVKDGKDYKIVPEKGGK